MVEPYDEPRITPDETIIRRINPEHHVVPDENTGGRRISTKAFKPSSRENDGMSVDILGLIVEAEIDPVDFVTTPVFTGSVMFKAEFIRNLGLLIGYDPIDPENPFHGEVWGYPRPNRFSSRQERALLAESQWFVEIPGVLIPN